MFISLQQFKISDEILGSGTYGQVKLSNHKISKKNYAIKIIDSKKLKEFEKAAIQQEIQIKFYNSFEQNNQIVIILEYGKNGCLAQYLQNQQNLDQITAYKIFSDILNAITYLHNIDILHRDIKPENIVLDQKGNAKLIDFGWCAQGIKIKRNTFCGTYEYMSPEVVLNKNYAENIDLWSLGILLYEMIHGYTPFDAKCSSEIMKNIVNKEITYHENLNPNLKYLLQNILNKNPAKRFNTQQIQKSKWMVDMEQRIIANKKKNKENDYQKYDNSQNFYRATTKKNYQTMYSQFRYQ